MGSEVNGITSETFRSLYHSAHNEVNIQSIIKITIRTNGSRSIYRVVIKKYIYICLFFHRGAVPPPELPIRTWECNAPVLVLYIVRWRQQSHPLVNRVIGGFIF